MRNKRADCALSRLFCTGDVEALGDPNSGAQAEPRIGSLGKIVLTKIKVLTELLQWPRSLFQGTVTSGQVGSLPGPSLVWALQGKRRCSLLLEPLPVTWSLQEVLGHQATGDIPPEPAPSLNLVRNSLEIGAVPGTQFSCPSSPDRCLG